MNYVNCYLLFKSVLVFPISKFSKTFLMPETVMNGDAKLIPSHTDKISWRISFVTFGRITVTLPLGALFVCFISAIIFQFDEVNQTVCKVQNTIPSISAITGITPQRYIWRVCIALHSAPRFAVGFIYYHYYMRCLPAAVSHMYSALVCVLFWVYTLENSCLVGVTYIANVENYPVHEKIFVVFMVTSLLYELLTLFVFKWAHPVLSDKPRLMRSYRLKQLCFFFNSSATAGLLYYFFRHRWFCEPGAFTMFSACEYVIAVANILFHYTAVIEFGKTSWCLLDCSNQNHHPSLCCSKDVGHSNGPIISNRLVSITDYDNNDRKKLS